MKPLYWILIGAAVLDAMVIVAGAVCSWSCNQIVGCVIVISVLPLLAYYFSKRLICCDEYNVGAKRVYIVVFDCIDTAGYLKSLCCEWCRVTEYCYIIPTYDFKYTSSLRNALMRDGKSTKIMVINITGRGFASYGLKKEVTDWIKELTKSK